MSHFGCLFKDLCNLMDIVYVTEDNFGIPVVSHILIPSFLEPVGLSIHVWSCVVDNDSRVMNLVAHTLGAHGCLSYLFHHLLVFNDSCIEHATHALRASPDRAVVVLVVVAQSRKPLLCPELRASYDLFFTQGLGHHKFGGVSSADIEVLVVHHFEQI